MAAYLLTTHVSTTYVGTFYIFTVQQTPEAANSNGNGIVTSPLRGGDATLVWVVLCSDLFVIVGGLMGSEGPAGNGVFVFWCGYVLRSRKRGRLGCSGHTVGPQSAHAHRRLRFDNLFPISRTLPWCSSDLWVLIRIFPFRPNIRSPVLIARNYFVVFVLYITADTRDTNNIFPIVLVFFFFHYSTSHTHSR